MLLGRNSTGDSAMGVCHGHWMFALLSYVFFSWIYEHVGFVIEQENYHIERPIITIKLCQVLLKLYIINLIIYNLIVYII